MRMLGKLSRLNLELEKVLTKPRNVDVCVLKDWVFKNLPADATLRKVILKERDQLAAEEFAVKVSVWLHLAELEE